MTDGTRCSGYRSITGRDLRKKTRVTIFGSGEVAGGCKMHNEGRLRQYLDRIDATRVLLVESYEFKVITEAKMGPH